MRSHARARPDFALPSCLPDIGRHQEKEQSTGRARRNELSTCCKRLAGQAPDLAAALRSRDPARIVAHANALAEFIRLAEDGGSCPCSGEAETYGAAYAIQAAAEARDKSNPLPLLATKLIDQGEPPKAQYLNRAARILVERRNRANADRRKLAEQRTATDLADREQRISAALEDLNEIERGQLRTEAEARIPAETQAFCRGNPERLASVIETEARALIWERIIDGNGHE